MLTSCRGHSVNQPCNCPLRVRSYYGPYSVGMRENTDQKNSKYGHFLRSGRFHVNP